MIDPIGLLPFVPSGRDFKRSREFFRALGFEELWASAGHVGFCCGAAKFILQDLDAPDFAGNLVIKIELLDLDTWWDEIAAGTLFGDFPEVKFKPPTDYPWGREVHFINPAGVCWHVGLP